MAIYDALKKRAPVDFIYCKGFSGWKLAQEKKAKTIQTPFRAVTNSGDLLCREYYTCGGPCQTFQSRPGLSGLRQRFGAIQYMCDGTGVPPAACNVKYVYDSSNYTTYLKQKAINYNYNDYSYGGDENSASQSAWRRSRRQ